MTNPIKCPSCFSTNKPEATRCRVCGRPLREAASSRSPKPPVILQRVMSGEVFTALLGDVGEASAKVPEESPAPVEVVEAAAAAEPAVEDNSDVIAAAVDRIRSKAQAQGVRFKPYVPGKGRRPATEAAKEDAADQLAVAVGRMKEGRFEEALEPLLKAIARDDEERRAWLLLSEAYLRLERPYKAAVGYLRVLELRPKDEQAWLGLSRVLRSIDELPTAAGVLERAAHIHPAHPDIWAERGIILESMQNLSEAMKSFAKVLELRPDHRLARERQRELEAKVVSGAAPSANEKTTEAAPKRAAEAGTSEPGEDILDEMAEDLGRIAETAPAAQGPQTFTIEAPRASKRPARVRTFVEGLDETLDGGVPWGHVVLIEGAPGTMKSSLGFSILLNNAAREGLHGLYLSLEERTSSLLKQMGSLGLKLEVPKGSLIVLDPRTASDLLGEKKDWVDALRVGVLAIKEQRGLDLIVIDSLEALEVLAKLKDRRREMYRLFEWLRDLGVTSFVITERPDWIISGHVLQGRWDEDFLADGVLQLRIHFVTDLEAQRRLRIVKMRGSRHETGYLAMVLDEGRFRVTRAMSS